MIVTALGPGWRLTVGGRDLRVVIEYPGSQRGFGNDARCFTLYVTGNQWHAQQSCTSNLPGNKGTSAALHLVTEMALAHFVEVYVDCDAGLKSEEGLPELPLPATTANVASVRRGRNTTDYPLEESPPNPGGLSLLVGQPRRLIIAGEMTPNVL